MAKSIRILGFSLIMALSFTSCYFDPIMTLEEWNDIINPPEPIEVDTPCVPELFTDPAFVTGFMIIDEPVTTDVVIHVGQLTDTIQPGEDMSSKLKNLLFAYNPNYTYQVYVSDTDWRRICFFAKGTNDHNLFHGKVYLRFNQYNTGWGFAMAKQAFYFAGALNYDEYSTAIDSFPSYDRINWMMMDLDSTQYDNLARKAAKCKLGRYYANFRFNTEPLATDIPILYDSIGWDVVLH